MLHYHLTKKEFKLNVIRHQKSLTFFFPSEDLYKSSPYVVILPPGEFFIECWGSASVHNGYGAYAAGTITLNESKAFYLYIGVSSKNDAILSSDNHLYNGGGAGQKPGGGATDIRLIGGEWYDFQSLKSRILVAAGAGGLDNDGAAGHGGGLIGCDAKGSYNNGKGGTQTAGGEGAVNGAFGMGGSILRTNSTGHYIDSASGGGSGYYGGSTGAKSTCCGGGGGSSFISGHPECDAIDETSTVNHIIHTGQSKHYSGVVFTNTTMTAGDQEMPLPDGSYGLGYSVQSGAIRITSTDIIRYELYTCYKKKYTLNVF